MVTRLYLHSAFSLEAGTLPTTEQSTKTATLNYDAQSNNRSMDTTIGTGQVQLNTTIAQDLSALKQLYVSKFVSPELNQTSVAANTWRYNFAIKLGASIDDYPTSDTIAAVVPICCYVWRPSTGTKVGNILDGNSATAYQDVGFFPTANNNTAILTETSENGTFTGAAVASVQAGDVIIFEAWVNIYTTAATSALLTWYYDGTIVTLTNGTNVSDHASFLETPENLVFQTPTVATGRLYKSFSPVGFAPAVASVTF